MNVKTQLSKVLLLLTACLCLLSACSLGTNQQTTSQGATAETDRQSEGSETSKSSEALVTSETGGEKPKSLPSLRIGLMPALDSLPLLYAKEKGLFEEQGLEVEFELFNNLLNRQSALQAGTIDGCISDLISFYSMRHHQFPLVVSSQVPGAFRMVWASSPMDLLQRPTLRVATAEVSVVNYLTDRQASLEGKQLEKLYINEIPARLISLQNGESDVAVLPEPLASRARERGLVVEEGWITSVPDVLLFRRETVEQKADSLRIFHQQLQLALQALKEKPEEGLRLFAKTFQLPEELATKLQLPADFFEPLKLPSVELCADVRAWMNEVLKVEVSEQEDAFWQPKGK